MSREIERISTTVRHADGTRLITLRLECDEARLAHFRRLVTVAGYLLLDASRAASA